MINQPNIFSFSQPISFRLFANHGEKVFLFFLIIILFFTRKDLHGKFLSDVIVIISVLVIILVIVRQFVIKIIWRFDIDFLNERITFHLCRNDTPVDLNFSELDEIKVSGPIVFSINKRKLYYSTPEYEKVLKVVKKIKPIRWGVLSDIMGPGKAIREIIDNG